MYQVLRLAKKLTSSRKKFIAEVIGTFIVIVFATGSVVIDAKLGGVLGVPFIAFAPFVGVAVGVYLFGKISMAHFNPAVNLLSIGTYNGLEVVNLSPFRCLNTN